MISKFILRANFLSFFSFFFKNTKSIFNTHGKRGRKFVKDVYSKS